MTTLSYPLPRDFDVSMLDISEIFLSIQGEGVEQGNPTIFVRLFGCNYNCAWCDTDYAKKGKYKNMTVDKVIEEIDKYAPYYYVQITGGEPLIQEAVEELVDKLLRRRKTVWINTNGSQDIEKYTSKGPHCRIMIDIKPPSSGMSHRTLWRNLLHLRYFDQITFVIATKEDYEFAKTITKAISYLCPAQVLFSPMFKVKGKMKPELTPAQIVEKIKEDELMVRLSLQLHKILWNSEKRGV